MLIWDDDPGVLAWQTIPAGGGDMTKAVYDADDDGKITPEEHASSHSPQTGGDPLSCTTPSELAGVQASAAGTADYFARSDHQHQIQHAITDNHLVTIDQADVAASDYAKWTANGLSGRSYAEVRSDLDLEAGTDFPSLATFEDHSARHESGGADAIQLDNLAATDDNTDLNASTTKHGLLIKAVAPAANELAVVGIANGETIFANKVLFDATNPAALGVAAPGTSLYASHRDHVHAAPAGGSAASQAEQEAAAEAAKYVAPATQQFHPSAAKVWCHATANSTTINASYNMTSWADTATGQATGTIATDFSSANWCGQASMLEASGAWDATYTTAVGFQAMAAGTFRIDCSRMTDGGTAAAAFYDGDYWFVVGFGDLP